MWLHWVSMEQIDSSVTVEDMLVHPTVWLAGSPEINNSVNSYFSVTWCVEMHGRRITDGTVSHYVGILQFLLVRTAICPSHFLSPHPLILALLQHCHHPAGWCCFALLWEIVVCWNRWSQALQRGLKDFYFFFFSCQICATTHQPEFRFQSWKDILTHWNCFAVLDIFALLLRLSDLCNYYCFGFFFVIFRLVLLPFQMWYTCKPCVS